jgi:hypothetical protein
MERDLSPRTGGWVNSPVSIARREAISVRSLIGLPALAGLVTARCVACHATFRMK